MIADAKIEVVEHIEVIEDQQARKDANDRAAKQQEAACSEHRKNCHWYGNSLFQGVW